MAEIIHFDPSPKNEPLEQKDIHPSDELGTAIQILIQQLRTAPLQRVG